MISRLKNCIKDDPEVSKYNANIIAEPPPCHDAAGV